MLKDGAPSGEELFAPIWERPATETARELGISDAALGKLCRQLQVPKPPRGYWAGVTSGKSRSGRRCRHTARKSRIACGNRRSQKAGSHHPSCNGLPGREDSALFLQAADHIVIRHREGQAVLLPPGLVATVTQNLFRSCECLVGLAAAVGAIGRRHDKSWSGSIVIRYIDRWRKHMPAAKLVITAKYLGDAGFQ